MKLLATGICLFVIGLTAASAAKSDAGKWKGVVSEFYKGTPPPDTLKVTTAAGNDIAIGSNVTASLFGKQPKISYKNGKPNDFYTFIVFARGQFVDYVAWMSVNAAASNLGKSVVVVPYPTKLPAKGSEPLLFILLAYKQQHKLDAQEVSKFVKNKQNFIDMMTIESAEKMVGKPVAGHWLITTN